MRTIRKSGVLCDSVENSLYTETSKSMNAVAWVNKRIWCTVHTVNNKTPFFSLCAFVRIHRDARIQTPFSPTGSLDPTRGVGSFYYQRRTGKTQVPSSAKIPSGSPGTSARVHSRPRGT